MSRFIEGQNREQSVLFPERLDDYIGEDNPVRVIDAFVDELDLAKLGFDGVYAEETGRPRVPPRDATANLRLRIYESHPVEPPAGARDAAQSRIDLAHRSPVSGLQDHRGLSSRQRTGDPARLCSLHLAVPDFGCSPRRWSRSTEASSRPSTIPTAISASASSRRASNSSSTVSAGISTSLIERTENPIA